MIEITGVHVENAETNGIVIEDGRLVSITGCYIEHPDTEGIRVVDADSQS